MYISKCCVICRISSKFPSVEKFHRWMWGQLMSVFFHSYFLMMLSHKKLSLMQHIIPEYLSSEAIC